MDYLKSGQLVSLFCQFTIAKRARLQKRICKRLSVFEWQFQILNVSLIFTNVEPNCLMLRYS